MTSLSIYSCDFNKSIHKDLATGLVTRGDGLSCESVYLAKGEETIKRNSFIYGEKFLVVFNNIEGFHKTDNYAFPGMSMRVTGEEGEVLLEEDDLYSGATEGYNYDPLQLHATITAAAPIHSGNTYHLEIKIWDKKGEGTFTADLDFNVEGHDQINIESQNVAYEEIYLYSREGDLSVEEYIAGVDETIFMLFEGLEGFTVVEGKVHPGLSLSITDANGNTILDEEDLMGDTGMEYADFHSQVAPNFILTGEEINNPVTCKITIWDKGSEARISASTQFTIVNE
ncbi:MAG: hypothetical protein KAT15_19460 [Bacteroidales bacterium]|nr:hypothetical protein [Bacteroidales bacterium]